jgi:hypothetical protein
MQQYTGLFHTCSTQLPIEPLLTALIACHVAPPSPSPPDCYRCPHFLSPLATAQLFKETAFR